MMRRRLFALVAVALVSVAAWLGVAGNDAKPEAWSEVAPGIWRTPRLPVGYALVDNGHALLIDAPRDAAGLKAAGVKAIEGVLLTHHHWDTCAAADSFLAAKTPVRAPAKSAEWLLPDSVTKFWQDNIPLRHSRAAYLVVPRGLRGVDCSLKDGQTIDWHGWTITVVETPGHSRDHVAYAARKGKDGKLHLFCGDALASAGKLWSPYTTDWDHWTDAGLKPAAESLRKLADLKPDVLLPAHGPVIAKDAGAALTQTAEAVEEAGFFKSFERFTKQRLGNPPDYAFLAKEQKESGGKLPWSQVSKNLFLTGNTYVLTSKDNAFVSVDPWGKLGADQIAKLKEDRKLGDLERVFFSHAHYDHYDGVYHLPDRKKFEVWSLREVAIPISQPFRYYAPFLDARPVDFDHMPRDGSSAVWREYTFTFHNFPGQSLFTMAIETTIDGKKCLFTADNYFHQDMFSGSGGWMGLNRSFPSGYATSAQKVLDLAPDWVLAEHGGPFEFNKEDFRRRVQWGKAAQAACDALAPRGNGHVDWFPQRVRVEPILCKAKPGDEVQVNLFVDAGLPQQESLTVTIEGPGIAVPLVKKLEVAANGTAKQFYPTFTLRKDIAPGRHVYRVRAESEAGIDPADAFVLVDVEKD